MSGLQLGSIKASDGQPEAPDLFLGGILKRPFLVCAVAIAAFFGIFGAWATFAPLAGGAIASGVISPLGSRKTIQHLEGGIIQEFLVKDGDEVAEGQPLLVLARTRAEADFGVNLEQRRTLAGAAARLEAEQQGADGITFPQWLEASESDPAAAKLMAAQRSLFETRRRAQLGQKDILSQRVAQLREEITGLEAQIASQVEQVGLIDEEIKGVQALVDKGLERTPRLLSLKRQRAEIEGERAENAAAVARAGQAIGETELQILNIDAEFLANVADELNETRFRLAAVEKEIIASEDVLDRTTIAAPVPGTVLNKRFSTIGGVIPPGAAILDIVPSEDDLIIEAQVSPLDIDVVFPGLEAKVQLSAFAQRNLPQITGKVRKVSADALVDETTNQTFYKAEVEVDREQLERVKKKSGLDLTLTPGMPAEVLIVTGERTLLQYLTEPLTASLRRSFRES
ncbi:MAG: HlyD family type I secretion periplasmic adaptor subunit [Pseudomonadota bacterium]